MLEYTFSMIKPDAVKRCITGLVNSYLEKAGLKIVAQKMLILTILEAKKFYQEHENRSFFDELITYSTSGPVIMQVLKGENAVLLNRKIMGATNPDEADEGTIRKDFGLSLSENTIHGSDSKESAAREMEFFFAGKDILS